MRLANKISLATLGLMVLSGCNKDDPAPVPPAPPPPATFTVGGTLSGLNGSVTLANNGGDARAFSANGAFTFPTAAQTGAAYNVTVTTQPANQTCAVTRWYGHDCRGQCVGGHGYLRHEHLHGGRDGHRTRGWRTRTAKQRRQRSHARHGWRLHVHDGGCRRRCIRGHDRDAAGEPELHAGECFGRDCGGECQQCRGYLRDVSSHGRYRSGGWLAGWTRWRRSAHSGRSARAANNHWYRAQPGRLAAAPGRRRHSRSDPSTSSRRMT